MTFMTQSMKRLSSVDGYSHVSFNLNLKLSQKLSVLFLFFYVCEFTEKLCDGCEESV